MFDEGRSLWILSLLIKERRESNLNLFSKMSGSGQAIQKNPLLKSRGLILLIPRSSILKNSFFDWKIIL